MGSRLSFALWSQVRQAHRNSRELRSFVDDLKLYGGSVWFQVIIWQWRPDAGEARFHIWTGAPKSGVVSSHGHIAAGGPKRKIPSFDGAKIT